MEERLSKMSQDVSSYLQLMEVKDASIVKLSNKLDELELSVKIDKAGSPPIVGQSASLKKPISDSIYHFTQQQMEAAAAPATLATWRRFQLGPRPSLTRRRRCWRTQSQLSRCRTSFSTR